MTKEKGQGKADWKDYKWKILQLMIDIFWCWALGHLDTLMEEGWKWEDLRCGCLRAWERSSKRQEWEPGSVMESGTGLQGLQVGDLGSP